MFDILKHFEEKFSPLKKKGLKIKGLSMTDPKRKKHVISISKPFLFDNRKLPRRFEGLDVKAQIEGMLPVEFNVNRQDPEWTKKEYIWAPERFEKYVDRCASEIRETFKSPGMERQEMLDALCFGNFNEHKIKCNQLISEGKLPPYREN